MKKAKRVIQRNLSIADTYTILGSYYVGMENGTCCDNCGRIISNVAEIRSNLTDKVHCVGMDCAETLSGIKGDFDFEYVHKANFSTAKQARATILKQLKKAKELNVKIKVKAKTFTDTENYYKQSGSGMWSIDVEKPSRLLGNNWKQYQADVWSNYVLPMIKDLTNA